MIRATHDNPFDCDCGSESSLVEIPEVIGLHGCSYGHPPDSFELSFTGSWRVAVVNGLHLPLEPGTCGNSRIMLCDFMLERIGPLEKAEIMLMR